VVVVGGGGGGHGVVVGGGGHGVVVSTNGAGGGHGGTNGFGTYGTSGTNGTFGTYGMNGTFLTTLMHGWAAVLLRQQVRRLIIRGLRTYGMNPHGTRRLIGRLMHGPENGLTEKLRLYPLHGVDLSVLNWMLRASISPTRRARTITNFMLLAVCILSNL